MSNAWSIYVIALTAINVLGCWWLLHWTAKRHKNEAETTGHVWDGDLKELNNPLPRWWLILFYITIVFGIGYLILYPGLGNFKGVLNWNQIQRYENEVARADQQYGDIYAQFAARSITELRADPTALKYGQRLFTEHCALCHGSDGRGAPGFPNLADHDWLYGGEPEQVLQSILNGRKGIMPPFGETLAAETVEQIAAYVVSLRGEKLRDELVQPGKKNFALYCAACHGPHALGNQMLGAPNLTDNIWLYSARVEAIKHAINTGLSGEMPAHRELLSEDKARLVAAYVLSLNTNHHD